MKTLMIAIAAASLAGATLIGAEASAAPYGGPGGFKSGGMKPVGPGGFKAGPMKPGGFKPGFKPGPGGLALGPGKPGKGGGAWKGPHGKGPHKGHGGHGHWGHSHWGYGGYGLATAAYFASPVYVGAYEACEWVRVRTSYGWRWRPYC